MKEPEGAAGDADIPGGVIVTDVTADADPAAVSHRVDFGVSFLHPPLARAKPNASIVTSIKPGRNPFMCGVLAGPRRLVKRAPAVVRRASKNTPLLERGC